jgi:hypothetical protein
LQSIFRNTRVLFVRGAQRIVLVIVHLELANHHVAVRRVHMNGAPQFDGSPLPWRLDRQAEDFGSVDSWVCVLISDEIDMVEEVVSLLIR